MEQYTVRSGQNIYDIALTLHGSVEGIFDLLISNNWLNMETVLEAGKVLNYHKDFVINSDIVAWLNANDITVKNGEHTFSAPDVSELIINHIQGEHEGLLDTLTEDELKLIAQPVMVVRQQGHLSSITLTIIENKHIMVDWGDDSGVEIIEGGSERAIEHYYKDDGSHVITIYGYNRFRKLDISDINGTYYILVMIYAHNFSSATYEGKYNKLITITV